MRGLTINGKLEEADLKRLYQNTPDKRERIRWHALWLKKRGMNASQAAKVVGRSDKSVRKWVHWYNARGSERIKSKPQEGKEPKLNEKQLEQVDSWLEKGRPEGGRWTLKLLKEKILEELRLVTLRIVMVLERYFGKMNMYSCN